MYYLADLDRERVVSVGLVGESVLAAAETLTEIQFKDRIDVIIRDCYPCGTYDLSLPLRGRRW